MKTFFQGPAGAIPERIRNLRESLGITGYELARRAGVSPSYMSLIEKGVKVPSEGIAVRLAEALGDDPDIYRAWVHAARHPDLEAHLGRMQRLVDFHESPELSHRLRRGASVDESDAEVTLDFRAVGSTEPASERKRRWFRLTKPKTTTSPEVIDVPLLPDGVAPGSAGRMRAQAIETLRLDRRLLPPDAKDLFAYRPADEAAAGVPSLIHPGDLVVLTRHVGEIDTESIYAVRRGKRVVLTRVLLHGNLLLLIPRDPLKATEAIEADDPEQARSRVVGVVLTTVRSWSPRPRPATKGRPAPRGRTVRLEGDFLVRDCEWRERYGWRPHQRPEDLDYLEAHPGTKIRFRLIKDGRVCHHLEMTPAEWREALGEYVDGPKWRANGYIVAITRRESGDYTLEFQERWAPYVRDADD